MLITFSPLFLFFQNQQDEMFDKFSLQANNIQNYTIVVHVIDF